MPRFRRLQITSEFRAAVRADDRGIVRLAHELGIPAIQRSRSSWRDPTSADRRSIVRASISNDGNDDGNDEIQLHTLSQRLTSCPTISASWTNLGHSVPTSENAKLK